MRGLWGAVLLAPVLANALAVPPGNVDERQDADLTDLATVHISVDVPSHDEKEARPLAFALQVLESEEPCGHGNVKLNGQVLPQTLDGNTSLGKGSLKTDRQSIVLANWAFKCINVNGVPDSQLMRFNVDVVDGKAVKDVGFSVLFQQSGEAKILNVDTNLSVSDEVIGNPNPERLRPAKDGQPYYDNGENQHHDHTHHDLVVELDYLWGQLREIEYLIHQKERALAHHIDAHQKVELSECDSLKCVVKSVADHANDAVEKLYSKFRGNNNAGGGRWGRPPPHNGPSDRPFGKHGEHKGNHTHGEHPPHGPGNHTQPPHWKGPHHPGHLPLPICRYPPPPRRGHHRGPPRGGPPRNGPPGHDGPPHHHDGPPRHGGPPPHDDAPEFPSFHHVRPHPEGEKFDFSHHPESGGHHHFGDGGRPQHPDDDEHMPPPPGFDGPEREGHHMPPQPPPFFQRPEDDMSPPPNFDGPDFDHPSPPPHDDNPHHGPGGDHRPPPPPPPPFNGPPGPPGDRHHNRPPFGPGHGGPNHIGRALQIVKFASIGFIFAFLLLALHRRHCTPQRRADRQARREERHRRRAHRRAAHKHIITRILSRMSGDGAHDDYEEKDRLMEDAEDGQSTTMTEDLAEFRNAADVVGDMVATDTPAPSTPTMESQPLLTPAPTDISNTDLELASSAVYGYSEELPAYEDNDGSDLSSIISDGFRPGQMGNYTPSHSSSGSVSDILGPDTKS